DMGDIFQYTSYIGTPAARLVKLSPPTASGKLTTLCCDQAGPEFANIDISAYDISFDAKQIVFAGKLNDSQRYGLFLLTLADGSVTQIASDPQRDYVEPIFLPGDKVFFMTNAVVEPGAPQHVDEYERGTTTQVGTMNLDGTGEQLGPRNLSHRSHPFLASDGRIMFTNWDHLGPTNQGDLMFMNTDMTELREAFGKEGTSASNSTLSAREISPGRFIAIATSRDRTLQSGALIDVRLGFPSNDGGVIRADTAMSEANASYVMLTPDVPVDREPSADTIGRYHDAFPLNAGEHPDLVVSWADGPVESSVLSAAGINANFGVYLYNTATFERHPILDDPNMWDIYPRPLQPRTAPAATGSQVDTTLATGQALVGSMNVYTSTLHQFQPGEVYGVRVMEGFSSEEGFPRMFGTTMFEGHANLGVARVASDGSWLAKVPANVPLHLQAVDNYGMSLFNEPVWFSARSGESRVCGGCHEDRAATTIIQPGQTQAAVIGPKDAMSLVPRAQRLDMTPAAPTDVVGVGWDNILQPMFTAKCVSCHDGTPSAANPTYTITDPTTNQVVLTWTFNLKGDPMTINYGNGMMETFSASYFTMAGPDMEAIEKGNLVISGNFKVYMNPEDARGSIVVQKLNPTQLFPSVGAQRAFSTAPHSAETNNYNGAGELSATEFYELILAADMGVNFYARENNPHSSMY
ncbi:MAG: hypothetical protein ACM31C_19645, partial [Acidobacteriota bacterium]